ncbi:MAG: AgmX/PglI C-terminal domain-containing protein [Myxococcota bacterium]|nr:AgmX/PglI C-terminal domain-containing protein [Myxococcota bacterium]
MEKSNSLMLVFDIYIDGTYKGKREFEEEAIALGSGDVALSFPDADLKPLHAVFNITDSTVSLVDLGAGGILKNGELVNSNAEVKTGDKIEIGRLRLDLKIIDQGFAGEEITDLNKASMASAAVETAAETAPEPAAASPTSDEETLKDSPEPAATPQEAAAVAQEKSPDAVDIRNQLTTETGIREDFFEGPQQESESPLDFVHNFEKSTGSDLLEVAQLFGPDVIDVQYFSPSKEPVTIGQETAHRLRFAGQPIAWVPSLFAKLSWMMYPFTQAREEWKTDFFSLEGDIVSLFEWNGETPTAKVPSGWDGYLSVDGAQTSFQDLLSQNKAVQQSNGIDIPMAANQQLILKKDSEVYAAQLVGKKDKFYVGLLTAIDAGMVGIAAGILLASALFVALLYVLAQQPQEDNSDDVAEMYQAMLEMEPEPEPEEEEDANKDAGEGAKAKEEEGKVGKPEEKMEKAKGDKIESKQDRDKKVVDNFMSGLDFGANQDAGDMAGASAALDNFSGGLGGVLGAKGIQAGSGGLGAGGGGLGGGGSADGLGGLGSKGMGRGRSGYGTGGGSLGKKKKRGAIGKIGGSPIILGGLDKSLIDAVIKRNMSQIRYCYQRQLSKNPSLGGKIVIKFVIAKDGSVSKANVKSSSMGSSAVESCIAGRFKRFQFPKPNGGIVIVSYPFIFSPG